MLLGAEEFQSASVGEAGAPSGYRCAFERLAVSSRADRHCKSLVDEGHSVAALYGLVGVFKTDPVAFSSLADQVVDKHGGELVTTVEGCIVYQLTVADLVDGPAENYHFIRNGSWTEDLYVGLDRFRD